MLFSLFAAGTCPACTVVMVEDISLLLLLGIDLLSVVDAFVRCASTATIIAVPVSRQDEAGVPTGWELCPGHAKPKDVQAHTKEGHLLGAPPLYGLLSWQLLSLQWAFETGGEPGSSRQQAVGK